MRFLLNSDQRSLAETEEILRVLTLLPPLELWFYSLAMSTQYMGSFWGPIPNDGVFFTSDALDKLENLPFRSESEQKIPYFITINSFEGSSLQESIRSDEFKLTDLRHYTWVGNRTSSEEVQKTADLYRQTFNAMTGKNVTQLSQEQAFTLGTMIYGDSEFRRPAWEEAKSYANAGATVYMLYFDTDTEFDIVNGQRSCCGVAHAAEILYTFGYLRNWGFGGNVGGKGWEMDLTTYIMSHFTSIVNNGEQMCALI